MSKLNIVILAENPNNFSSKALKEAGESREHKITIIRPTNLILQVSDIKGHDRIYLKSEKRLPASHVDVIIPRLGTNLSYATAILRHMNENMKIPTTATAQGLLNASDKLLTTQLLSKKRVPVPKTTYVHQPNDFNFLIESVGGLPCVAKLQTGSQGQGVFLIETPLAGATTLSSFSKLKVNIILQEFLETSVSRDEPKSDIRAYVVGDKVVGAYMRKSVKDDFRSNFSISKQGVKVKLNNYEQELAVKASKAVGLDVSGVDLVRCINKGETYCIEVNGNASLNGITKVTGIDIASKIIEFAESKAKKTPIKAHIEALSDFYFENDKNYYVRYF